MRIPAAKQRWRVLTSALALGAGATLIVPMASVAAPIPVPDSPQTMEGFTVQSWHGDRNKSAASKKAEYQVGESVVVTYRVENATGKTVDVNPVAADVEPFAAPARGNCRWGRLNSPNRYSCDTPRHVVTAQDRQRGFFNTDSTWDIVPNGENATRVFIPGVEIDVLTRNPAATLTVATPTYQDVNNNSTVDTGDTVTLTHTISNTGNVTLTALNLGGNLLTGVTLAPGQTREHPVTRELTEDEIRTGHAQLTPATLIAHNGKRQATVTPAETPAVLTLPNAAHTPVDNTGGNEGENGTNDNGATQPPTTPEEPYTPAPAPANGYEEQLIVQNHGGPDKLRNYRIPALIQLNNGHILLSYDGRPNWGDAPQPNWIIQQRSIDGGKTFQERTIINRGHDNPGRIGYSDPSYVYDAEANKLFNFHVYSKDVGFWASNTNDDDNDRNVISANVAVSTDNGHTWTNKSVTSIIKAGGIGGVFATSGNGIQKRFAPHKGRLLQPFVVIENGVVRAAMLYSDDHGETWHRGGLVGSSMDENKVVELSDGTLMLNSRVSNRDTWRKIATSTDGGQTWGEVTTDHTLIDPRNNASIIQMNPTAQANSREAKELLFSNAASTSGRQNGSVRYSCDDGRTWPVVKTYRPGAHAYSDLAALKDGTFGVFFEAENDSLWFGRFTREWLNPFCANFAPATANGDAGQEVELSVTIRNDDTRPLPAGTARVHMPNGWQAAQVATPEIAVGDTHTATVRVTIPESAVRGTYRGEVTVQAGTYNVRGDAEMTVVRGAQPKLGATIVPSLLDTSRDVTTNPYRVGEEIGVNFRVTSTSSLVQTIVPASGELHPFLPSHGAGNCRYRSLAAGAHYNCNTPKYTVTETDVARGYIAPVTTWTVEAAGFTPATLNVAVPEVALKARELGVGLDVESSSVSDANNDGYHEVGDTVSVVVKATNNSNVTADSVAFIHGNEKSSLVRDLAQNQSATHTWTHTLTVEDIQAGYVVLDSLNVELSNGSQKVNGTAREARITLYVQSATAPDNTETEATKPAAKLTLPETELRAGEGFTLRGTGFTPGAQVRVELHSTPKVLGTTTADTAGAINFAVTIPASTEAGDHTLKAFEDERLIVAQPVSVEAASVDTPGTDNSASAGSTDNTENTGDARTPDTTPGATPAEPEAGAGMDANATETGNTETGNTETGNTETGNTETGNTETDNAAGKPEENNTDDAGSPQNGNAPTGSGNETNAPADTSGAPESNSPVDPNGSATTPGASTPGAATPGAATPGGATNPAANESTDPSADANAQALAKLTHTAKDSQAKKAAEAQGANAGKSPLARTGATVLTILAIGAAIAGIGGAALFLRKK